MARGRGSVQDPRNRVLPRRPDLAGGRGRGGRGRPRRTPSPMPFDAQAQRESAELGNEAADARAAQFGNYTSAQSELGFGLGTENPYSQVAENRRGLAANQRGIVNTAGNQLYSGSTLNARSEARSGYDRSQKAIEDKIAQAQADYNQGQAQTTRDEQTGLVGIKAEAVDRAAAAEPAPLGVGSRRPTRGRGRVGGAPVGNRRNRGRGRR